MEKVLSRNPANLPQVQSANQQKHRSEFLIIHTVFIVPKWSNGGKATVVLWIKSNVLYSTAHVDICVIIFTLIKRKELKNGEIALLVFAVGFFYNEDVRKEMRGLKMLLGHQTIYSTPKIYISKEVSFGSFNCCSEVKNVLKCDIDMSILKVNSGGEKER